MAIYRVPPLELLEACKEALRLQNDPCKHYFGAAALKNTSMAAPKYVWAITGWSPSNRETTQDTSSFPTAATGEWRVEIACHGLTPDMAGAMFCNLVAICSRFVEGGLFIDERAAVVPEGVIGKGFAFVLRLGILENIPNRYIALHPLDAPDADFVEITSFEGLFDGTSDPVEAP